MADKRIRPSDPDKLWARRWVLALIAVSAYVGAMIAEAWLGHEYPSAVYWALTVQVIAYTAPAAVEAVAGRRR